MNTVASSPGLHALVAACSTTTPSLPPMPSLPTSALPPTPNATHAISNRPITVRTRRERGNAWRCDCLHARATVVHLML